ncbi:WAT1-related protein-like isoform X1 [Iris pallida]|uniref:WAT1-related protein-like isoform X1 n=1 Tax=Iris pallida TaxID=29817 RepID=A0AAX6FLT7_IRIPA|nr:WAT1-related protein-like isoform X1 [Iris pallida]
MDFMIAMEGGFDGGDGRLTPWVVMLVLQLLNVGSNLLFKKILNRGCFILPVLTYRNLVAAVSVAPFAVIYEREMREHLTWGELFWMLVYTFLTALFEVSLTLWGFYIGMRGTTASYSSNIMNITPVITYILPVMLYRIEKCKFRSREGKLKLLGTFICIGGAILSTMKRPMINNNLLGTVFILLGASVANAVGQMMQEKLLKARPTKYLITTWMCLSATLQTAAIGIFLNPALDNWRVKWDLQLVTILYSGFLNTVATYFMISWVIPKRGCIFPSKSISFSVLVTAVADFLMGEPSSCGSNLGMVIIMGGLQVYLWTKDNEEQQEQADAQRHVCTHNCRRRPSCGSVHLPEARDICTCSSCGHRHRMCTCPSCGHRHTAHESRELEDISEVSQVDEGVSEDGSLCSSDLGVGSTSSPQLPDSGKHR